MDSYDIFKQITTGVRFHGKRTYSSKHSIKIKENNFDEIDVNNIIKSEIEDNFVDKSLWNSYKVFDLDFQLKEEIKSDDEESDQPLLPNYRDNVIQQKRKRKMSDDTLKKINIEKTNHLRNLNHIHVSGKAVPNPITKFEQLHKEYNVTMHLINNLSNFGYTELTPIQMQTIPIMLQGRHIFGCAPTGSGKTIAFLLPVLHDLKGPQKKGFRALILCPTRELAKQTQRECLRLSDGIDYKIHIISNINQAEMKYGRKSSKKFDILITTPKRVCYLLNQDSNILDLSNIEWLILDETDKLFESSANSFREQFDQISNACTSTKRKVALFSATHTHEVAMWAKKNLKGMITVMIGQRNTATTLIDQELLFVGSESGKLLAIRELVRKGLPPPVLIFVQSKSRAQQLYNELLYDGVNVDVIHADRTQTQRDNVVRAFREGKIWILICTEIIGRGIDFKGVNLVVNYDFPPSTISYIHRIGRTGRAGRRGRAITFFTQEDTPNLRGIANIMKNSNCTVPEYMLAMKKIKKTERRKMERFAQKREEITTKPKFLIREKKQKRVVIKKIFVDNTKTN